MMNRYLKITLFSFVLSVAAQAEEPSLASRIEAEIAKNYPDAKIEMTGPFRWTNGEFPSEISEIRLLQENGKGEAELTISGKTQGKTTQVTGWAGYSALVTATFANKRILPAQKLARDMFVFRVIDLAKGPNREFRGVMLSPNTEFEKLESRQTILEGNLALSTGVQQIPDVRRGDAVRILLISGELTLSTQGQAEEPAFLDKQVRVMAQKTKKHLMGVLKAGGIVEVKL